MIHLDDFLRATGGTTLGPIHESRFARFAFDSRRLQPGDLFLAVKSERGDGHDFVAEAIAKGAAGVVVQRPVSLADGVATMILVEETQAALQQWGRFILAKVGAEVIGVTGSTGKTTTKETIAHLLAEAWPLFKNPGNWNGRYGLPLALGQLQPEQRLAVLEMASDSLGEIADLAAMAPPRVAVVTTVQPAHLDTFGDLATIADEKADLVRALPADGLAFLNADDPHVRAMAAASPAPVRLFGLAEEADLRATDPVLAADGTRFTLLAPSLALPPTPVWTPLLGRPALYATLAALGVALHYGLPLAEAVARLATMARVPGRLHPLAGRAGSLIIDDSYNASPAAMLAALDLLATLPARRRVAVLGDMAELGSHSAAAHAEVGARAAAVVDRLVTKGEQARAIAQAAEGAGLDPARVLVTYTTADAVAAACEGLGEGDIVLVKGGMVARMERISARLLAHPADTEHLVRQDEVWEQVATLHLDRPTWLAIDLDAIAHNTRRLRAIVGPTVALMAVIKADAYGHGALPVAQTALHNGAGWLGVACLPEARTLREGGISAPMLVLGYTPPWQARAALRLGVRATLFSLDVARAFSKAAVALGHEARVHVKVDTGMHRLGLFPDEVPAFLRALRELPNLIVEGLFTHFSVADAADPWYRDYTRDQLARFQTLVDQLRAEGLAPPILHAANSAATLTLPAAHFDMVRPGIALYGLAPSPEVPLPDFRPALSWKTQVAQVKRLPAGAAVSYGATYRAEQPMTLAVIPVGYADGFRRAPATWGTVLVRGQRAPLVGRVCMDQAMLDVSHIPGVRQGDEVVLIGAQGDATLTVEEVADRLGTIPYEVVAAILARVPRVG